MKTNIIFGLTVFLVLVVSNVKAQEFTLTTTPANINKVYARASIDLPGLTGNTLAIIVATPLGNTETLNPHPICAWYDGGKWYLYNADDNPMPVGAKYSIQFFPSPGPNQFLHVITKENLGSEGSYIDNPALNNNPNAQVKILQNHAPQVRVPSQLNHYAAKAGYSSAAGKWYITNVGGERMLVNGAYNIVIGSGSGANANTNINSNTSSNSGGQIPSSLPPNGNAGGDLGGTYPNPSVQRLLGKPISGNAPAVGQSLKWNGSEWTPTSDAAVSSGQTPASLPPNGNASGDLSGSYPAPTVQKLLGRTLSNAAPSVGQILKWNGTVWEPANDNVATATVTAPAGPMQTFFKVDNTNVNRGQVEVDDSKPERILTALSHSIVLTKRSRLIISVAVTVYGPSCALGCSGEGFLQIKVDNLKIDASLTRFAVAKDSGITTNLSNYMIDLNPGTHNIEFLVGHHIATAGIYPYAMYSSIMVVPL